MLVLGRHLLSTVWNECVDLRVWVAEVTEARWKDWAELRRRFPSAEFGHDENRIVFWLAERRFRVAALINFPAGVLIVDSLQCAGAPAANGQKT
jgi:mRNA-degrading endonuclease HigB of HigAB toxin-antitoxin module